MPSVETSTDCCTVEGVDVRYNGRGNPARRVVRVASGLLGRAQFIAHSNSVKNLARGICERVLYTRTDGVLAEPLRPVPRIFEHLNQFRSALIAGTRSTTVVALESYPELYCGRKRVIYQEAVESLCRKAICKLDSHVRTFVKFEKVQLKQDKPDPPPRVIQPRSPRYNVLVGRYLKLFEKNLYLGIENVFGYSVVLKGLNATGTAESLREKWNCFSNPVAIGLDASRFDQHVSSDALRFEHSVYNAVFKSPELRRLLEWQIHNRGRGYADDGSVSYEVEGCRMSGDINTSMGNCLIMCAIMYTFFETVGMNARLANNGDDCVVFCEKQDEHHLDAVDAYFRAFGFKLTRETTVSVFERVEFCQGQPVWTDTGYRMVRNPYIATSKDAVSKLDWSSEQLFLRWRHAIGTCGLELSRGVPFWEAYYKKIWAPAKHAGSLEDVYDSGLGYMAKGVKGCSITPEARLSFWKAFDMTPDEQEATECAEFEFVYHNPAPMMFCELLPYSPILIYK